MSSSSSFLFYCFNEHNKCCFNPSTFNCKWEEKNTYNIPIVFKKVEIYCEMKTLPATFIPLSRFFANTNSIWSFVVLGLVPTDSWPLMTVNGYYVSVELIPPSARKMRWSSNWASGVITCLLPLFANECELLLKFYWGSYYANRTMPIKSKCTFLDRPKVWWPKHLKRTLFRLIFRNFCVCVCEGNTLFSLLFGKLWKLRKKFQVSSFKDNKEPFFRSLYIKNPLPESKCDGA